VEDNLKWKKSPMEEEPQFKMTHYGKQPAIEEDLHGRLTPMEDDL
jgi:hypothetical protein